MDSDMIAMMGRLRQHHEVVEASLVMLIEAATSALDRGVEPAFLAEAITVELLDGMIAEKIDAKKVITNLARLSGHAVVKIAQAEARS